MSSQHIDSHLLAEIERVANKLWRSFSQAPRDGRLLVGFSGIPGAGKSTITHLVAKHLNRLQAQSTVEHSPAFAVSLPMDGFHFSRAYLASMPEPEVAIHRRGAAFTCDADGFLSLVQSLRAPVTKNSTPVFGPSFDHVIKDPVQNSIAIYPTTKIILFEGNYCALDRHPWSATANLMDELWFIDVNREVARDRLVKRHVASGVCSDLDSARHRVESTDFLNADDILENLLPVQEVIKV